MKIDHVTNAKRVGQIGISTNHDKKLTFVADSAITRDELRDDTGRVYFITSMVKSRKLAEANAKEASNPLSVHILAALPKA